MRRAIHGAQISAIRYGFDIADAARLGIDDREFFRQFTLPAMKRSHWRRNPSRCPAGDFTFSLESAVGTTAYRIKDLYRRQRSERRMFQSLIHSSVAK
jgi:hypothetical protein